MWTNTHVQDTSPTADQDTSRKDQDTPRDQDTPLTDPSTPPASQVAPHHYYSDPGNELTLSNVDILNTDWSGLNVEVSLLTLGMHAQRELVSVVSFPDHLPAKY